MKSSDFEGLSFEDQSEWAASHALSGFVNRGGRGLTEACGRIISLSMGVARRRAQEERTSAPSDDRDELLKALTAYKALKNHIYNITLERPISGSTIAEIRMFTDPACSVVRWYELSNAAHSHGTPQ